MSDTVSLGCNNSMVKVHNIFEPLPKFMFGADIIYSDPPWVSGNITGFYRKAGLEVPEISYTDFADMFLLRVSEIKPGFVFIEMGKEYLGYWLESLKKLYKYVTFYNSYYYNKLTLKNYVIQATNWPQYRRFKKFEDMESDKILWQICEELRFDCIGDLCMGLGTTGKFAYLNNRRFVGTELNSERLQVLIDYINKKEKGEAL